MDYNAIDKDVSAQIRKEIDGASYPAVCDQCYGAGRQQTYIAGDGWTFERCSNCDGVGSYELQPFHQKYCSYQ